MRSNTARRRTAGAHWALSGSSCCSADQENIREVTMFPMNQQAEDLLLHAPIEASDQQLKDVHIRVVMPEKKDHGKERISTGQFIFTLSSPLP